MAGGNPRVVGDVNVARLHGLDGETVAQLNNGFGHRVDVSGRAGHGLSHHATTHIKNAGRYVATLAHNRAECGADQCLTLLFDHGEKAVPHDLIACIGCLRHCVGPPELRVSSKAPLPRTSALKSLLTKVVVCGSTISAGPVRCAPDFNKWR